MTPESLSMVADRWNRQLGAVWAELLAAHAVDPGGVVVEIGPGFADKIGLGLAARQFRGTLFVVEPNRSAREWVTLRYHLLLPAARIVPVELIVPEAAERVPEGADAVLMNHVLDDLVLHAALPPDDREPVFAGIRPDRPGPAEVRLTWERLLASPDELDVLGARIVGDVLRFVEATAPRVFGASQYESSYLTQNGLREADRFGASLLADLETSLGATCERDRAILRRHGWDPTRWLVRGDGGERRGGHR